MCINTDLCQSPDYSSLCPGPALPASLRFCGHSESGLGPRHCSCCLAITLHSTVTVHFCHLSHTPQEELSAFVQIFFAVPATGRGTFHSSSPSSSPQARQYHYPNLTNEETGREVLHDLLRSNWQYVGGWDANPDVSSPEVMVLGHTTLPTSRRLGKFSLFRGTYTVSEWPSPQTHTWEFVHKLPCVLSGRFQAPLCLPVSPTRLPATRLSPPSCRPCLHAGPPGLACVVPLLCPASLAVRALWVGLTTPGRAAPKSPSAAAQEPQAPEMCWCPWCRLTVTCKWHVTVRGARSAFSPTPKPPREEGTSGSQEHSWASGLRRDPNSRRKGS